MTIEMTCRDCRRPFTPTREDIVRGPSVYRTCPACRAIAELTGFVARHKTGMVT